MRFFGYHDGALDVRATLVGLVTLLVMMTPSVWTKSKARLYPVLLGLVAGYVSALLLGVFALRDDTVAPGFRDFVARMARLARGPAVHCNADQLGRSLLLQFGRGRLFQP